MTAITSNVASIKITYLMKSLLNGTINNKIIIPGIAIRLKINNSNNWAEMDFLQSFGALFPQHDLGDEFFFAIQNAFVQNGVISK